MNTVVDDLTFEVVNQGLQTVYDLLQAFAERDDFLEKMTLAFGGSFDAEKVGVLRQAWASGNFEVFPGIEVRTGAELNGANGAFAAATNTIYLSRDYLERNEGNLPAVTNVLLEEFGHFVDAQINRVDAAGDEGAIFAGVATGERLDEVQIQRLRTKDDRAILNIDSQLVEVEQQITTHPQPPLQSADYQRVRLELLRQLEGTRLEPYLDNRTVNPHPTIGRGFDLRDADTRNDIFAAFGINENDPNEVDPEDSLRPRRTFGQELIGYINQAWSRGQDGLLGAELDRVMARRARILGRGRASFVFTNADEVDNTFNTIIQRYEDQVTDGLNDFLPNSFERVVAVSLAYVGDFGSGTRAAINNGDRAEAWYEIRYYRGNNDYRRHNVEAKIFGLYNPPNPNPTQDATQKEQNALQIFRMLNKHELEIYDNNANYLSDVLVNANNELQILETNSNQIPRIFGRYDVTYSLTDPRTRRHLRTEFEPAKTVLVSNFATLPDESQAELRAAQFLATNSSTSLPRPYDIDGIFVAAPVASTSKDLQLDPDFEWSTVEVAAHTVDRTTREANNNLIYIGHSDPASA